MNILPTSCDAEDFSRIDSWNYGWELRVEVRDKTMEEVLSKTVLYGMTKEVPASPDFTWISGNTKHYIIEGFDRLNEIKAKLDEQKKYDSHNDEALEGVKRENEFYKLKLFNITKGKFAGTIAFQVTNDCELKGKTIIRGYPMDLNTYLRIPRNFGMTHKFLPIALFSPTQVGKSTLLASLLAKGLADLPDEYEHELGHWEKEGDYVCDWYMKQANGMKSGRCPALTQPTYKVPPVFINLAVPNINESGEVIGPTDTITVGIYDFSGEALDVSGAGYDIVQMLPHMKGIIYLTGPESVPGFDENQDTKNENKIRYEEPVKILTLPEQAAYQKIYGEKHVRGLAAKTRTENPEPATGRISPTEFYDRVVRYFGKKELHNIHLAYVIAKSDRLEGQDCLSDIPGVARLFEHDSMHRDLYQSDKYLSFKSLRKIEESIITERILDSRERKIYEKHHTSIDGVKHVSYHMVSATGCECRKSTQIDSKDSGDTFDANRYDPIRVAEPFLVCIREMLNNGMYYEG